ncbi:hypothetical protein [Lacipirellula sp.]|uniref:hypothetical protein n=1 Tax=Lacipirellula sp. TaxID=2691419 RepID=UPI003D13743B
MPTTYHLTLEAKPQADDPDGVRRVRMALKKLLRSFGLKCVRVEPAVHQRPEHEAERPETTTNSPAGER